MGRERKSDPPLEADIQPIGRAGGLSALVTAKASTVIPRFMRGTHLSAAKEERKMAPTRKLNHGSRA